MIELGHLTGRKPPFRYAAYTRVAFSDTDAQGVVYYGRYLPVLRPRPHRVPPPARRSSTSAAQFVMRASAVEYHAPARFDDLLEVFVRVERIGRTSVTYDYAAYRLDDDGADDILMATAKQTVVLIDHSTRIPVPVPGQLPQRGSPSSSSVSL